jgi:hypothetical protein
VTASRAPPHPEALSIGAITNIYGATTTETITTDDNNTETNTNPKETTMKKRNKTHALMHALTWIAAVAGVACTDFSSTPWASATWRSRRWGRSPIRRRCGPAT